MLDEPCALKPVPVGSGAPREERKTPGRSNLECSARAVLARAFGPAPSPSHDAALFVWSCWLAMSVAGVVFVAHYAWNMPLLDQFSMVPILAHQRPVTLQWLWSLHNEHRIPLPRLVQLGLAAISNNDFRAGMYFNVIAMSLLAACLVLAARRIRGTVSYTDAFFPILLLHWGHAENFLWGFQVAFTLSTLLFGWLVLLITSPTIAPVRANGTLARGPLLLAGLCMLLLLLCGAHGAILVPALALWLGFAGLKELVRGPGPKLNGALAVVLSLAAGALLVGYLTGFASPGHHLQPPSRKAWLLTSLNFMSVGLGPAIRGCWPYDVIILAALTAVVLGVLAVASRSHPEERQGIIGLLLYLAAIVFLAAAIGKGRAFIGDGAGFAARYALLAAPFPVGLYLAVGRWGTPSVSRFVQSVLLGLAAILLLPNFKEGQAGARGQQGCYRALFAAVHAGTPLPAIATQLGPCFYPKKDIFVENMELMRQAGLGPYRGGGPKAVMR